MPIEAPISELGLFDLFQLMSLTAKQGILKLTDDESKKIYTLYFKDGKLAYVDLVERLREEIIKRELVSEDEITSLKCEEFIEYIIGSQVMTRNTFKLLFEQVAMEVIYSLFIINSGHFIFEEVDFSIPYSLDLGMRIENIILEAARRMDEISKIEEVIHSRDIVLEVSSEIAEIESINLDSMEWKLLSLINGKRTIADIIRETGEEFTILKSLYGLIMTGIVTEKKLELSIEKEPIKEENKVSIDLQGLSNFWHRREFKKGIEKLSLLRKRHPDDTRIIYESGYYYLTTGDFKKAISVWNTYLLLSEDKSQKKEVREILQLVMELSKKISDREVFR